MFFTIAAFVIEVWLLVGLGMSIGNPSEAREWFMGYCLYYCLSFGLRFMVSLVQAGQEVERNRRRF